MRNTQQEDLLFLQKMAMVLNEYLGLQPPIFAESTSPPYLKSKIREALNLISV